MRCTTSQMHKYSIFFLSTNSAIIIFLHPTNKILCSHKRTLSITKLYCWDLFACSKSSYASKESIFAIVADVRRGQHCNAIVAVLCRISCSLNRRSIKYATMEQHILYSCFYHSFFIVFMIVQLFWSTCDVNFIYKYHLTGDGRVQPLKDKTM